MDERQQKLSSDIEEFKCEFMVSEDYLPMMRALADEILNRPEEHLDPWKMGVVFKDKYTVKYLRDKANEMRREIFQIDADIDRYYREHGTARAEQKDWWLWLIGNTKDKRKILVKRVNTCEFKADMASGKQIKESSFRDITHAKSVPVGDIIGSPGEGNKERRKYCCPIHNEKTPSFVWYIKENRAKCFGCGWFGDSIDLYMKINNVDFKTAVNILNKF
jgi:hypothetical protein